MKCEVCEKVIPNGDEIIVEAAKSVSGQDTTVCSVKCAKTATKQAQPEPQKRQRKGGKRTGDFVLMQAITVTDEPMKAEEVPAGTVVYVPRLSAGSKVGAWKAGIKAAKPGCFRVFRGHGDERTLGEQRKFGFVE